jgi:hypothetical protein
MLKGNFLLLHLRWKATRVDPGDVLFLYRFVFNPFVNCTRWEQGRHLVYYRPGGNFDDWLSERAFGV